MAYSRRSGVANNQHRFACTLQALQRVSRTNNDTFLRFSYSSLYVHISECHQQAARPIVRRNGACNSHADRHNHHPDDNHHDSLHGHLHHAQLRPRLLRQQYRPDL